MVCLRLHFFWNMVIANAFIKKGTILIDNTIIFNNNYLIKNNAMLKIYLPSYYWKYYMKPYAILRLHFKEYYQVIFNVEYSLTAIGGVFFNFQLFEYDIKINFKNKFLYWNHLKLFNFLLNNY